MTYVLALIWVCAIAGPALVVWLIREMTTPSNGDLVDLQRYRQQRVALDRLNSRHSISTASAERAGYGNGHRLPAPAVEPLGLPRVWASEGRPATTPVTGAKADRPNPADRARAAAIAGTTGRAAHAPRAHAGPSARHLRSI